MTIACHIIDFGTDLAKNTEIVEGLAEGGLIRPVLLLCAANEGFEALLVGAGPTREVDALEHLSSLGRLDAVTISVVVGPDYEPEKVKEISDRASKRADQIRSMVAQSTEVREVRAFAPEFDRHSPPNHFFSDGAINVLIIPEDRASDIAVARPVKREDEWFVCHVVVEIFSLLGVWSAIQDPPVLDRTPRAGGLGEPLVSMFRSFCRVVRGPEAVANELLPDEGVLPTPVGFLPAPDPEWLANHHAVEIFPDEFRFHCPEFEDPRRRLKPIQVLRRYLKEFGRTILGVPKLLVRGIAADLDQAMGRSVQSLYGEHSWVQVESGMENPDEQLSITESEEAVKAHLASVSERPNLALTAPTIWTNLVRDVLGAADGSEDSKKLNQVGTSKAHLLVQQENLGYQKDMAISEVIATELGEEQVGETDLSDSNTDHLSGTSDSERRGLIPSLTRCFADQIEKAREQLDRSVAEVLGSRRKSVKVSEGTARGVVVASLVAATALFIIMVSTTQLHSAFAFEGLSSQSRARLWVLFSLFVAYVVSLCLAPTKSSRTQTYLVATTSLFAASVAAVALFYPSIHRGVRRVLEWSGEVPIYVFTGAVVLVGLIALTRHLARKESRGSLSIKVLITSLFVYLLLGSTIALSRDGSIIQEMSSSGKDKLQFFVSFVGLTTLLACLVVVTAVRIREMNAFDLWLKRLQWNLKVAEFSASEEKLLSARLVQWLGTAAPLSRLIWFPLGKAQTAASVAAGQIEALQLQKFKMAEVALVDRGKEAFTARIRRLVAGQGWLTSQYEKVASQYGKELALRSGLLDGDIQASRPETCSFPETLSSIDSGRVSSRRWEFALDFEAGAFDSILAERVNLEDRNTLFTSVLSDATMYQLVGSSMPSISDFMDEVSVHVRPVLPPSAVKSAPVVLAGQGGVMEASIWWPSAVLSPLNHGLSTDEHESALVGPLLFSMRCDWSSPVGLSQLAGAQRGGGNALGTDVNNGTMQGL